jgi:hypothetical protein
LATRRLPVAARLAPVGAWAGCGMRDREHTPAANTFFM